jgi:hypothetical protein
MLALCMRSLAQAMLLRGKFRLGPGRFRGDLLWYDKLWRLDRRLANLIRRNLLVKCFGQWREVCLRPAESPYEHIDTDDEFE